MTPPEELFYFQSNARALLGVFHQPPGKIRCGLLVIHPFGEEKKCAHRTLVETARALPARDVAVLRFDLSGCGDSQGAFRDARLEHWRHDIRAAWEELGRRTHPAPRGLLGLRLGAALASRACADLPDVAALCLWQPVVHGQTEFTSELRRLLIQTMITGSPAGASQTETLAALARGEGEIELDGYPVTAALYRDICAIDLAAEAVAWPKAVILTQFSRPTHPIQSLAQKTGTDNLVVPVRPVWIRSDFLPTPETGELLARECLLPALDRIAESH